MWYLSKAHGRRELINLNSVNLIGVEQLFDGSGKWAVAGFAEGKKYVYVLEVAADEKSAQVIFEQIMVLIHAQGGSVIQLPDDGTE